MTRGLAGVRWRLVRAVVSKDLAVVRRSRMLMFTMIALPVILVVVMPIALVLVPVALPGSIDLARELAQMPRPIRELFAGHSPAEAWVRYVSLFMFAQLFLVVPLTVAMGVAADSIAGERERKTLEALLFSPLTDLELYAAKVMGAWTTALLVALASFVLYGITVNLAGWPVMGRVFFPTVPWLLMLVWVVPAVALLGLGTIVLISARAATSQEAFQMGSFVVIPVVILMAGQLSGVVMFGSPMVAALGLGCWIVAAIVLRVGYRRFRRPLLLNRV